MPLRAAARAACLSRAFLCSWRCYPNLIFNEDVLRSEAHGYNPRYFSRTVDHILSNHSSIGLKILKIGLGDISFRKLKSWLHAAITPGIVDITINIWEDYKKYKFPCSLLSEGVRNSIRNLDLAACAFHPTAELGTLRSLTSLCLYCVRIERGELECLLSNSPALEQLNLAHCDKITCLKIPRVLERLTSLIVSFCWRLQVIENQAPNLSSLEISGDIIIGGMSQVKNLVGMSYSKRFSFALAELPSIMPNLETLIIRSGDEVVYTPIMPSTKFLCLKHLDIFVTVSPPYDYVPLVSFLDASPYLRTLSLDFNTGHQEHESVLELSSPWKQMAEHHHRSLKSVKITRFSSAKSLVELTCYILKNAVSLECLTLDTLPYGFGCNGENHERRFSIQKSIMREAPRALVAIRTYIEDKVPTRVKLTIGEPCSQCHAEDN
ncbi:hypothetical protein BS78_07G016900 [Paspalum vaginatum]|nr:hypothetical protein BS78_07G016900 [Paspalum vaginatum]